MVERLSYTQLVPGSSPGPRTANFELMCSRDEGSTPSGPTVNYFGVPSISL
jgi:hypothetical protein